MPRFVHGDPRDETRFPPQVLAADGQSKLMRYRVDAVVYAPNIEQAYSRVAHDIYLDGAKVERA